MAWEVASSVAEYRRTSSDSEAEVAMQALAHAVVRVVEFDQGSEKMRLVASRARHGELQNGVGPGQIKGQKPSS
eukprot:7011623-Prymnesium_polylepis.1